MGFRKYFKENVISPLVLAVLSGTIFLFYPSIDDTLVLS
jgi:hypothetical protein